MTDGLPLETKITASAYSMIWLISINIIFFTIGAISVFLAGWGGAIIASYVAALNSFPIDDILTGHGFLIVIIIAIPILFLVVGLVLFHGG